MKKNRYNIYLYLGIIFLGVILTSCSSKNSQTSSKIESVSNKGLSYSGESIASTESGVLSNTGSSYSGESITSTESGVLSNSCTENLKQQFSGKSILTEPYKGLFEISEDRVSEKDWGILQMLLQKNCNIQGFPLDEYDTKICSYYEKGNIEKLKNENPDILDEDIRTLQSINASKNLCNLKDESCNLYFNLFNGIKNNDIPFPKDINAPKIEFYGYKKLYPENYNNNLQNLFLDLCKNQGQ